MALLIDPIRNMPDPNAVAARAFGSPVVQGPPQNFFQRLQNKFMPAPSGGLLSDEDVKNARMQGLLGIGAGLLANSGPRTADQRVGLMESLSQGLQQGQQAYGGAVDRTLESRMGSKLFEQQQQKHALDVANSVQQLQAGQAQQQEQARLAAGRQAIFEKYGAPDTSNPTNTAAWLDSVMPELMALGDTETLGRFSEVRKTLGGQGAGKEPGTWVTVPGPDGRPMKRYVTASEAGQGIEEYQEPTRDTNAELTVNSRILREEGLEKNYDKRVDDVRTTVNSYLGAEQAAKLGGAGDLQVLYSFIRALDPQSVVREGEVALARQAASLWSQAHILKNKFEEEGGTLSPVQRKQMLTLMKQMVELKAQRAREIRAATMDRAQRFGLEVYIPDVLEKYDAFTASQKKPAAPTRQPGPYKSGYVFPNNGGYDPSLDSYWSEQ